jgi:hypothetical protein
MMEFLRFFVIFLTRRVQAFYAVGGVMLGETGKESV